MNRHGFSLIELSIVIFLVGTIAAIVMIRSGDVVDDMRIQNTRTELSEVIRAITGDGDSASKGFFGTMGRYPTVLSELTATTGDAINPLTGTGWHGPYIDARDGNGNGVADSLEDAWSHAYIYDTAGWTIRSCGKNGADNGGGDDDIMVSIPHE